MGDPDTDHPGVGNHRPGCRLAPNGDYLFLGMRQAFLPEDTTPPRLVTDGLYRYVRHPLYTAGLVFIWLLPIMTWNLLALNIGLTAYILIGATFEERKLLSQFGETYADYRRKTPMLIPGTGFINPTHKT